MVHGSNDRARAPAIRRVKNVPLAALKWVAWVTCGLTGVFGIASLLALRRWRKTSPLPHQAMPLQGVTFFRPIKTGEPHLLEDLRVFLHAVSPQDQVLFGTACEAAYGACLELAEEFPHLQVSCVRCESDVVSNPKVNKLIQLEPFATKDLWVVLDSDTQADETFLNAFRAEWLESSASAISAPYCFASACNLDTVSTNQALWPGIALLRTTGRVQFLLGACMGVVAKELKDLGGWHVLGEALADDYELGHLVAQRGGTIHLTHACVTLRAARFSLPEWICHQHRAAVTHRLCNSAGAAGLPITFGIPAACLLLLANPRSLFRWLALLALLVFRMHLTRWYPGRKIASPWPLVLGSSLAEPLFWLVSWLPLPVSWNHRRILPRRARVPNMTHEPGRQRL